jgi:mannosyltransferase OCH1-like enzyme
MIMSEDIPVTETPVEEKPTIPRILHIVWVGPHRPPEEMIKSWDSKHVNGWFFVLWRDHKQGWINQKQIDGRYNRREYNGVADCMRYEILFKQGGICVDADSECIKALDEGPEKFLENTTAVACYENESLLPGQIACGFLGAPKGHPFFEACINHVGAQDPGEMAWKTVGPLCVTSVAKNMPGAIRVYPARHFNPKHHSGHMAPGNAEIYAQQGWGSTKGYNALRKMPCSCPECTQTMLRPSWG